MPNINKLFDKAEKFLQKDRLDRARDVFLEILQLQPGDETALLTLGEVSAKLRMKPDALHYWGILMDDSLRRGNFSRAAAVGRRILKLAPLDTPMLARVAAAFEKAQKTAEALEAYRGVLRAYRKVGQADLAYECLRHIVQLDPEDMDAEAELAQAAGQAGAPAQAASAFLKAAELARAKGLEDRYAEWVTQAHTLDPSNPEACLAVADLCLAQNRPADVAAVLQPVARLHPDNAEVLRRLARAFLGTGDYIGAEPVCRKLYQADPETIGMMEQLITGLLGQKEIQKALSMLGEIKDHFDLQGKQREFLAIVERARETDEDNREVLEMLVGLYDDLNRDGDAQRALGRLFHLDLAAEQYERAAETLEKIIDIDPYGAGNQDRLLNLEGHLDAVWYRNIAVRLQVPGRSAPTLGSEPSAVEASAGESAETLEDLVVEGEMYQRYHLSAKLEETLCKINRFYPGAQEANDRLQDLYDSAGVEPAPAPAAPAEVAEADGQTDGAPSQTYAQPIKELESISRMSTRIYREGTPQRVISAAVEQIGQALEADRCWAAMGSAGLAPALAAEYRCEGIAASSPDAAGKMYSFLMQAEGSPSGRWESDSVAGSAEFEPIRTELQELGVVSILGVSLMDKDERVGLLMAEQCRAPREWTQRDRMMLEALGPQMVTAVNNAKLRRLVRSLAGADPATGLLPRTAYLDCLLAEASRSKAQGRPLAVCLLEPLGAPELARSSGEAKLQAYLQRVSQRLSSRLRQNDIALRYGPYTVALCFTDTAVAEAVHAVEIFREDLGKVEFAAGQPRNFCAAICDVPLGSGFDAVDGVTEAINRLDDLMDRIRGEEGAGILVSTFDEQTV